MGLYFIHLSMDTGREVHTSTLPKIGVAIFIWDMVRWYPLYILGALTTTFSFYFFSADNNKYALLCASAVFAVGFIVTPVGYLLRKFFFKNTFSPYPLILLGVSTFLMGCLPGSSSIGILAPLFLILLRLVQGIALGADYDSVVHQYMNSIPRDKRGYYMGWLQASKALSVVAAIVPVLLMAINKVENEWVQHWRVALWISGLLILIIHFLRKRLLKNALSIDDSAIVENNGFKFSPKEFIGSLTPFLALGVVWFTGYFYSSFFLQSICNINTAQSLKIVLLAFAVGVPFIFLIGWISDKINPRWILLSSLILAIICFKPIYFSILDKVDIRTMNSLPYMQGSPQISNSPIPNTGDSLQIITAYYKSLEGFSYTVVMGDTLFKDGSKKRINPIVKDKELSNRMFWEIAALIFLQILIVGMIAVSAHAMVWPGLAKMPYAATELLYMLGVCLIGSGIFICMILLRDEYPGRLFIEFWPGAILISLSIIMLLFFFGKKNE